MHMTLYNVMTLYTDVRPRRDNNSGYWAGGFRCGMRSCAHPAGGSHGPAGAGGGEVRSDREQRREEQRVHDIVPVDSGSSSHA